MIIVQKKIERFSHNREILLNISKFKYNKEKIIITCQKVTCDFTASIKYTFEKKTRLVPSSFLISTSWFLILDKAFRKAYLVARSTAHRSATEKKWNESLRNRSVFGQNDTA